MTVPVACALGGGWTGDEWASVSSAACSAASSAACSASLLSAVGGGGITAAAAVCLADELRRLLLAGFVSPKNSASSSFASAIHASEVAELLPAPDPEPAAGDTDPLIIMPPRESMLVRDEAGNGEKECSGRASFVASSVALLLR